MHQARVFFKPCGPRIGRTLDYGRPWTARSLRALTSPAPPRMVLAQLRWILRALGAVALLLLVEDGKLSLRDDVRMYVPELPDYGAGLCHIVRPCVG